MILEDRFINFLHYFYDLALDMSAHDSLSLSVEAHIGFK